MADETAPDWATIEMLYRAPDHTLRAIAQLCGVSEARIRRMARTSGWPPRGAPKRRPASAPGKTWNLKERLINAMETKLRHIEERLEAGPPGTPAASERDTRELGTVARHLERMGAVEQSQAAPGAAAANATRNRMTEDDAERWRHEIAERLEKIAERLERRARPAGSAE